MLFRSFRDAMVFAFAPPAVLELGNATGFDVFLQDRAGVGHAKLMEARNRFISAKAELVRVRLQIEMMMKLEKYYRQGTFL